MNTDGYTAVHELMKEIDCLKLEIANLQEMQEKDKEEIFRLKEFLSYCRDRAYMFGDDDTLLKEIDTFLKESE